MLVHTNANSSFLFQFVENFALENIVFDSLACFPCLGQLSAATNGVRNFRPQLLSIISSLHVGIACQKMHFCVIKAVTIFSLQEHGCAAAIIFVPY